MINTLKNKTVTAIRMVLSGILLLTVVLPVSAQLQGFQSMYFQNPYLYNPAMAGMEKGLNINIGYLQQWGSFPGMPKTSSLTADYRTDKRVGLGLSVNSDQAGLIRSTRARGTYAYHLPLNGNGRQLHFGLSLGLDDSRVNENAINGDGDDELVLQYNQLRPYLDGDLGLAYTSGGLNVSAALPNLKSAFFKDSDTRFDADRLLFITVLSYRLPLVRGDERFMLEPLTAYRIVKGHKDLLDLGFNFTMENYGLYLQGIYHSSASMGLGVGLKKPSYGFSFAYNFQMGSLGSYTSGGFELGIKLRLINK